MTANAYLPHTGVLQHPLPRNDSLACEMHEQRERLVKCYAYCLDNSVAMDIVWTNLPSGLALSIGYVLSPVRAPHP